MFLYILLLFVFSSLCSLPLAEQFKQIGYLEICDKKHEAATFDSLYACFDKLIEFLHKHPTWAQKLYSAKERFIRSKDKSYYATDFFGFYDESEKKDRGQISFYYSTHFHESFCSQYSECKEIPEITSFFKACFQIQQSYANLFEEAAAELGLKTLFTSTYGKPPILFKVVKYLPSYIATNAHYDGTALTLLLDSTDNQSLLLSPYKSLLTVSDFSAPLRTFSRQDSILLIPGILLTEFSIYPTPHIVAQSGKVRYAAIAFAMRPNYTPQKNELTTLPNFKQPMLKNN